MCTQFWLENFKGISHFGSVDVTWAQNINVNLREIDCDCIIQNEFSQDGV
jgi:hypothetical protein